MSITTVIFLVVLLVLAVAYILKQLREKEELKQLLKKAIQGKSIEPKQILKVEEEINQVYLKQKSTDQSIRTFAGNPIYKIVITGGPCGGKSTSLNNIQKQMTIKGFRVFSIPEIPTLVVQAGGMILMAKFSLEERIKFQSLLIRFQIYVEDYFTRLAEMSKSPCIILCDRGTVDPAAYVSKEEFQTILDEEGWSWTTLRDRRYDRVIHLVTAAIGAEDFYTLSNNNARSEGIQVARALDKKTLDAWTGHPHITICPNIPGQSFEKKVQRAMRGVFKSVGLELNNNRYEKYLINKPQFPGDLKVETAENEQIFLVNEDERWAEDKIKRRGQNNNYTYQRKFRAPKNKQGQFCQEIRIPITSLQYVQLKSEKADKNFKVTHRHRFHFISGSIHYSIDAWDNIYGQQKTYILRFANIEKVEGKTLIPSWIDVKEDVRQNPKYSLTSIAHI